MRFLKWCKNTGAAMITRIFFQFWLMCGVTSENMMEEFTSANLKPGGPQQNRTGDLLPWNESWTQDTLNPYPDFFLSRYRQPGSKNYSAVIPFSAFFFWFVVHNSFAMLMITQRLSKNHAHSCPMQGISISNPSLLTAVPNFRGQLFLCDGIKNS